MKVDLEKAYDKMNWSFIRLVLEAFGFHQQWIGWVMTCVSTVSMNIMLNALGVPLLNHLLFCRRYFSIWESYSRDLEASVSDILWFERIPILSHYLGLPLFHSNKVSDFSFIVDKLDRKLAAWKSKLLSKDSRLVLIKYVGLAIPNYVMQSVSLPKTACSRLDSRIRKFCWGTRAESSRLLCSAPLRRSMVLGFGVVVI
ncbi:hypothetical protein UlMin_011201 [Ulmus minor]